MTGATLLVRRPSSPASRVLVLHATAVELELLVAALLGLAEETPCLDVRVAARSRAALLLATVDPEAALPLAEARRVRVGLRREREELERGGVGCRHVVEARAGRR
ncbi:hypothetical protein C5C56_13050 [Rathayibacter sp. AY1D1]|uniref:hypothetical protein n=1 Tax=Rathayibacter sp. AY1D1 TaxID=2080542 RepID=UPI000CE91B28|nr:hypothetical protein [Rathayibacter sp. AY1D1]PPH97201.1 hypothetical protein C5C56_13050 [Rathayibacter sp. AY1D1]